MSSSVAMKGIVIRTSSPKPDVYNKQRLLNGKYLDDHQNLLHPSFFGVIKLRFGRVGVFTPRCIIQEHNYFHGNGKNMSSSRQRRVETTRAHAILTPVSDPTPTMKKVILTWFFIYLLLNATVWILGVVFNLYFGYPKPLNVPYKVF